jgi:DnaJ-class molecular chaperone
VSDLTDAEINEGIAKFCGTLCPICNGSKEEDFTSFSEPRRTLNQTCSCCRGKGTQLRYTTSLDDLREAMGKMTEEQRVALRVDLMGTWRKNESLPMAESFGYWLLFDCPVRTLAEAVYQVVKGESK